MPFLRVDPDDRSALAAYVAVTEAARLVDDPEAIPDSVELAGPWMRYGYDLSPEQHYLYQPDGADAPVGVMVLDLPERDNRHLVWADVVVHPDHRRQGHGRAILTEALRRTREAGRTTVWVGGPDDNPGVRAFVEGFGFRYANHDARRRQRLAEVDHAEVARLETVAREAASGYRLERLRPPLDDRLLADLVEVTAAINDAPMGDLTFEDEVFDVERVRAFEEASRLRGVRVYRVVAREVATGEIGGHTVVTVNPREPCYARQGDTAVARNHRGHKLGLLLKIDNLTWLAAEEPQLVEVETWNQADNRFMIDVNEAIGYRLSRVFNTYQLVLT